MRQTVRIVSMDHPQGILRTGDRATVTFEFISHPEFIKEGMKLLFREGKTKVRLGQHWVFPCTDNWLAGTGCHHAIIVKKHSMVVLCVVLHPFPFLRWSSCTALSLSPVSSFGRRRPSLCIVERGNVTTRRCIV